MLVYYDSYPDNFALKKVSDKQEIYNLLFRNLLCKEEIVLNMMYIFELCPKLIYSVCVYESLGNEFYKKRRPVYLYDCEIERLYESLKKYNNGEYYFVDWVSYDERDGMYGICFVETSQLNFELVTLAALRQLKIDDILTDLQDAGT